MKRKSLYLNDRSLKILDRFSNEYGKSQTYIINDALLFYEGRGQYMEALIEKTIRAALAEIKPAVVRRRALVRRAGKR